VTAGGDGARRVRLASLLLRPFLGAADARATAEELDELRAARGGWGGEAFFWHAVAGYPMRVALEWVRDTSPGRGGMDGVWRDVGFGARSLARSPGFTVMTVVILAVSMGAATAIFSVVRGVLLDPLPYHEPDRLVAVWVRGNDGARARMTPGNVTDVRSLNGVFASVAAYQGSSAALGTDEGSTFVRGGAVTPEYFRTLGVEPLVGRDFRPEEGVADGPSVVMLGAALWRRAFGADAGIVGRTVDLNGDPFLVVGVAPSGVYPTTISVSTEIPFTTSNQDYFLPLQFTDELWNLRRPHIVGTVARLAPGVESTEAAAALATLTDRLHARGDNDGESLILNPFVEEVVGDMRFALLTLFATVGLVLLIAVVNVGALFVLRGEDRGSEIDVRVALGAPWSRLARQFLAESLLVAVAASLGAFLVARASIGLMRGLVPYQIPRLDDVGVDAVAMAATLSIGLAVALAFGLLPAWRIVRVRRDRQARGHTAGRYQSRLHGAVVALQAGLGVVVLVGAMLFARSFSALSSVELGFTSLDAWVIPISGSGGRIVEIVERIRGIPGVRSAARTYDHPLERDWGDSFLIRGRPLASREDTPYGSLRPFGEGYFETAGIRVVEGRVPDAVDFGGDARYAVVNESLRDRYFHEGGVLGATIDVPSAARNFGEDRGSYTIVGVVEDVRFLGPEAPSEPAFYLPLSHFPVSAATVLVRPIERDVDLVLSIRQAVREVAPGAAIQSMRTLQDELDDRLARPRFNMMLLISFATIGLVLSGLGAYGLVGRVVVARTREIGVRMALGADRRRVARSVLWGALLPVLIGGGVGIAAAAVLVRGLRSLLFEISPGDPVSFAASALFILGVGALAALVPTLRAVAVDPARTLRSD